MRETLSVLTRSWWIILGALLVCVAGALALAYSATPLYISTAQVYVSIRTASDSASMVQGATFAQQQMGSYAKVATSPLVLQPVADQLNLGAEEQELAGRVAASAADGTTVIELNVSGSDARKTALIGNAVADEFVKTLPTLERRSPSSFSPVRGTIIQRASVPTTAVSPKPKFNGGLGVLVGLLLGVVGAFARDSWDTKLRNRPGAELSIGAPLLGSLDSRGEKKALASGQDPRSWPAFDDFRRIRTNLQPALDASPGSSVLVTSAMEGEGKSTLALGLASAFAENGSAVALVDADLHQGLLTRLLVPHTTAGLSSVLNNRTVLEQSVVPVFTFDLLPAGEQQIDPSATLTGPRLASVLAALEKRYDVVIIDAPAVHTANDAARISHLAGLTVLVARPNATRVPAVRQAVVAISTAGGRVAGAAFNEPRTDRDVGRSVIRRSGSGRRVTQ